MRIVYFKRLSDQKEFRFLQVKNTGLEGVAKDGGSCDIEICRTFHTLFTSIYKVKNHCLRQWFEKNICKNSYFVFYAQDFKKSTN